MDEHTLAWQHVTHSFGDIYGSQRGGVEVSVCGPADAEVSIECAGRTVRARLAELAERLATGPFVPDGRAGRGPANCRCSRPSVPCSVSACARSTSTSGRGRPLPPSTTPGRSRWTASWRGRRRSGSGRRRLRWTPAPESGACPFVLVVAPSSSTQPQALGGCRTAGAAVAPCTAGATARHGVRRREGPTAQRDAAAPPACACARTGPNLIRVMIRPVELAEIKAGAVDLAFRRRDRPRVVVGTRMRTAVGLIEVTSVEPVDEAAITEDDARGPAPRPSTPCGAGWRSGRTGRCSAWA